MIVAGGRRCADRLALEILRALDAALLERKHGKRRYLHMQAETNEVHAARYRLQHHRERGIAVVELPEAALLAGTRRAVAARDLDIETARLPVAEVARRDEGGV